MLLISGLGSIAGADRRTLHAGHVERCSPGVDGCAHRAGGAGRAGPGHQVAPLPAAGAVEQVGKARSAHADKAGDVSCGHGQNFPTM